MIKRVRKKKETSKHDGIQTFGTTMPASQAPEGSQESSPQSNRAKKHFRLTCWRLLYHFDVQKALDRQDEVEACRHSHLNLAKWDEQKAFFPREWAKLIAKRQRRLNHFLEHGSIPDGWTPPDPKDPRRTAHKPIHAYLARLGLTLEQFQAKYRFVPMKPKKGGHKPNWTLILKIMEWTKEREIP